ncbi:MAG TPA: aspartyl protease family protein [Gammaproteobacteria bacterium]
MSRPQNHQLKVCDKPLDFGFLVPDIILKYFPCLTLIIVMTLSTDALAGIDVQTYSEVPIRDKQGMFVVRAHVNGKPADLYLDTGSTSSVIDQKNLNNFSITRNEDLTHRDGVAVGADQVAYTPITINQLSLGTTTFNEVPAVAMSLDDINQGNPNPLAGILGQDILVSKHALISFSHSALLLPATGGNPLELKKKYAVELQRLNNGFFIIPVSINSVRTHLLLDSGSPDIVLDASFKNLSSRTSLNKTSKQKGAQQNGNRSSDELPNLQSVQIGKYNLERSAILHIDLSHVTGWLETHENIKISGTLGLKALQEMDAVLDFYNAILYVSQR